MAIIRKKKPCRICRRWFLPDTKLKERRKTCGAPDCQREWHKRQCAEWNRKNADYFKANYLQKKVDKAKADVTKSESADSLPSKKHRPLSLLLQVLPIHPLREISGTELLLMIDYVIRLRIIHFRSRLMPKEIANKGSPI